MSQVYLKIGYMKFEELAEWAGIAYSTFRRKAKKDSLLNSLHFYCKYEVVRGGINIEEIYIQEYDKKFGEDIEFFLQILLQQPESSRYDSFAYIGTLRDLAAEYLEKYNEMRVEKGRAPITSVDYLSRRFGAVCNVLFSNTRYSSKEQNIRVKFNEVEGGPYGWKQGQLLIRDTPTSKVRELNKEDWDMFFTIASRMEQMKDVIDSQAFISSLVDYCDDVERTPEAIGSYVQEYLESLKCVKNSFGEILKRYRQLTGKTLVRGTVWILRTARGKEVKLLIETEIASEDIKEVCG